MRMRFQNVSLQLFEVQGWQRLAWAAFNARHILEDSRSEWFWEPSVWNSNCALQEFDDRFRERQFFSALLDLISCQMILHHELSQIADDLRRWCDLNNVAQQQVCFAVSLLDIFEEISKAQRVSLELQYEKKINQKLQSLLMFSNT